jgi:hypothetical protein
VSHEQRRCLFDARPGLREHGHLLTFTEGVLADALAVAVDEVDAVRVHGAGVRTLEDASQPRQRCREARDGGHPPDAGEQFRVVAAGERGAVVGEDTRLVVAVVPAVSAVLVAVVRCVLIVESH